MIVVLIVIIIVIIMIIIMITIIYLCRMVSRDVAGVLDGRPYRLL